MYLKTNKNNNKTLLAYKNLYTNFKISSNIYKGFCSWNQF